jgi:hypothetical protein
MHLLWEKKVGGETVKLLFLEVKDEIIPIKLAAISGPEMRGLCEVDLVDWG